MDTTRATRAWEPTTVPTGTVDDVLAALEGRTAVVLTGAGISTDSGVPDYRGPGAARATPMLFKDFTSNEENRRRYWARAFVGWETMGRANSNDGHRLLAEWEHRGWPTPLLGVITQNVDGLHEAAGTQRLVTLHGRIADVICLGCGRMFSREDIQSRLAELNPGFSCWVGIEGHPELRPDGDAVVDEWADFVIAPCEACGGILKPDVVFFGEAVPADKVRVAQAWVSAADVIVTLGTSLTVMSGLRFVRQAVREGKKAVVVNLGHTRADDIADVKVDASTSDVLARMVVRPRPPA